MTTNLVFGFLFCYVMPGAMLTGLSSVLVGDGILNIPPGSEPAVYFTIGLFWPLALLAGLSWLLYRCVRSVCTGFAVLWRHRRPAETLPRAVAKEKL